MWTPQQGRDEFSETQGFERILSMKCELVLLRMRLEALAKTADSAYFADRSSRGSILLRLWVLMLTVPERRRPEARRLVRYVQEIYHLTSEYLHGRRAAVVPPPAELAAWTAGVDALERLVRSERPDER
ncbi:hypothetical protein NQK81_33500 [Amycolatopsis roodepoortensis]|uniref:hypothetical protein n=1 Tax=Amycolatopsis roodepoortensis TaxID=700274 RepID=UPI00214BCC75|nr:hypothetical protein [Amycolatopsis roodepoortensis]UUV29649.1 hypothetical protein NQK81_33500 [Amycolatopsis roodepoortensis]